MGGCRVGLSKKYLGTLGYKILGTVLPSLPSSLQAVRNSTFGRSPPYYLKSLKLEIRENRKNCGCGS